MEKRRIPQLKQKMQKSNTSLSKISKLLGDKITRFDVSNFINSKFNFISTAKKKVIRKYFQSIGWLATPAPKEKCICPTCGRVHAKRKIIAPLVARIKHLLELAAYLQNEIKDSPNPELIKQQLYDTVDELIKVVQEIDLFKSSTLKPERAIK